VLVIMASCLPLTGMLMVANTIVVAMDRQAGWVKIMGCALLINIVLNVGFIAAFERTSGNGGIGVALASVFAESFQMIVSLRLLPPGLFGRELTPQIARALASTALMGFVVAGAQAAGLHLLFVVTLGAVTYVAASLLCGALRPSDLSRLARVWAAERNGASDVEYIERAPVGA
jgi:Na+-driven multidrug efflux pump